MLLSEMLKDRLSIGEFEIINEKPFKYLALTQSVLSQDNCVFLDKEKYIGDISKYVTMVITDSRTSELMRGKEYGICIVERPREVFFELHNCLANHKDYKRTSFDTVIGKGSHISEMASVANKNIVIGENVVIEEFVVIRENTVIGDNTVIRAGAVIGGHGFEFKRSDGHILSVAHLGGVIIGGNVEIQYNTCIDRAVYPWDNTEVGDYTKIDNLVHIGHAAKIQKNVMIVANSGIGGRTRIEDNTWIGFASTIINGIQIGENARANIGAVVTKSVPNEGNVTGNFAIPHELFIKNLKLSLSEQFARNNLRGGV